MKIALRRPYLRTGSLKKSQYLNISMLIRLRLARPWSEQPTAAISLKKEKGKKMELPINWGFPGEIVLTFRRSNMMSFLENSTRLTTLWSSSILPKIKMFKRIIMKSMLMGTFRSIWSQRRSLRPLRLKLSPRILNTLMPTITMKKTQIDGEITI